MSEQTTSNTILHSQIASALSSALIDTRIDDHGFEAFETRVLDADEMRVEVTLRGPAEDWERRPCECSDDEEDMCEPCIEDEQHFPDEPEYLTLVVRVERAHL